MVGDEGHLAHIDIPTRAVRIWDVQPPTDLEGVAIDATGRVLVLAESENALWHLDGGRRVDRWKIRPKAKKRGYEGLTITREPHPRLLVSVQGSKDSKLRAFEVPRPGASLVLLSECTLPWPDVAGLTWHDDALLALSDRGRVLARLVSDGPDWRVEQTWKTPIDDLEGLAVHGAHLYFAQDSGGVWRTPWPPEDAGW